MIEFIGVHRARQEREHVPTMKFAYLVVVGVLLLAPRPGASQEGSFDGLTNSLSNLYRVSSAKSFSISPENLTGEKGKGGMATEGSSSNAARELGQGWKVNPYVSIPSEKTLTLAEISGAGAIQHIWMTPTGNWR